MKLPRDLSGKALADILCRSWSDDLVHQSGSHMILETTQPGHQRIAIPNHKALRVGTLNGILRVVAQYKSASREDILGQYIRLM